MLGRNALIVIGVSGKYCSGKSFVSHLIAQDKYREIDVDKLGHLALRESYNELVKVFSDKIVTPEHEIDRVALKDIVFSNPDRLLQLEQIVHPKMVDMCEKLIKQESLKGSSAIIINAALLHRMHLDLLCDIICYVDTALLVRYKRAKVRDSLNWRQFIQVHKAQEDINSTLFDTDGDVYIIKNNSKKQFIHRQVDEFCITIGI